jgi:hypothetical protein
MIKEILEKMKNATGEEEHERLSKQMMDLLSDVKSPAQLKEAYSGDGLELSDEEAERLFHQLAHVREMKKKPMNIEELNLVSGGAMPDQYGPDGWAGKNIYRYKNTLYRRGNGYYIRALDKCAKTEDGWCLGKNDTCFYNYNVYDDIVGDERTDIDPGRMSNDFINGLITGGEDF